MKTRKLGADGPVVSAIDAAVPPGAVKGERYLATQMAQLDSEH